MSLSSPWDTRVIKVLEPPLPSGELPSCASSFPSDSSLESAESFFLGANSFLGRTLNCF